MISNSAAATYLYNTNRYIAAEQYVIGGSLTLTPGGTTGTLAVIRRGPYRSTLGGEVDSLDITIVNGALTYGGAPLAVAAHNGLLDGASFVARRIYDGTITVSRFTGTVQQVEPRATETRLVVKSRKIDLDVTVPKRIIQPACPYRYGDAACGASGSACNKSLATGTLNCDSNSNRARFGGFPFPKLAPGRHQKASPTE
jgi:hypothetical protein